MKFRIGLLFLICSGMLDSAAQAASGNSASAKWSSSLQLVPKSGYTQASIFGQGSVPAYVGNTYGIALEYLIGTPGFSVAPFLEYKTLALENTANSATQTEALSGSINVYGLMAINDSMFLKVGAIQVQITDKATGAVDNSKSFSGQGLELGAGLTYRFSPYVSSNVGLELNYFKIDPAANSVSRRLDYTSYTVYLSLRFGIPSGPTKP